MIRFLSVLLVMHFCLLSLISCSSFESPDENGASTESGPIEDTDTAAAAATAAAEGATTAPPKSSEAELENELDSQDNPAQQAAPAPEVAAAEPGQNPDDLENELDQSPQEQTPPKEEAEIQNDEIAPIAGGEAAEVETPPPPTPEPVAPSADKARIRDIHYLSNANGGTVVIETSKPVTFQTRMNPTTQQFVIEIADVELPAALQRPYTLKDFGSRFGSINAYQSSGSSTARVVIQMSRANSGEPIVQQEGTSLVVVPPATAPPVAESAPPVPAAPAAPAESAEPQTALAARTLQEFLTGNQKFYGRQVSLQVKDADIRDVVNFIAEDSGANIVMSDDVKGPISVKLRKIPWDQALVTVMRTKRLGYVRQGNVLRISTLDTLQKETEESKKLIEAQKNIVPVVVQVIPVSYSAVDEMVKAVKPMLTKEGQVIGDLRSGTLVVTDKTDIVERIAKIVKTLDIPPAQVSIESKIVEAVEGFENFVGVNWASTGSPVQISPGGGAYGAPISLTNNINSGALTASITNAQFFSTGVQVGTLDFFGSLNATLALAETDSLAKIISSPRISVLNREKSTITQQGENVSVLTTFSPLTNSTTSAEKRTPFKLELSVTPQITSDGGVIMDLDVERDFLGAVVDTITKAQPVNVRKAHTKVLVRNGQTAVIGGVYTSDELTTVNGFPGLMNIPVLGWLFKNRDIQRTKNELLIFLTPRIISADTAGPDQATSDPGALDGAKESTIR